MACVQQIICHECLFWLCSLKEPKPCRELLQGSHQFHACKLDHVHIHLCHTAWALALHGFASFGASQCSVKPSGLQQPAFGSYNLPVSSHREKRHHSLYHIFFAKVITTRVFCRGGPSACCQFRASHPLLRPGPSRRAAGPAAAGKRPCPAKRLAGTLVCFPLQSQRLDPTGSRFNLKKTNPEQNGPPKSTQHLN